MRNPQNEQVPLAAEVSMINRSLRRRNKWSMNRCDDKQRTSLTRTIVWIPPMVESHRARWTSIIQVELVNGAVFPLGWHLAQRMLHHRQRPSVTMVEITRLISPRGSSTRNPSINVVSCESYYRWPPAPPAFRNSAVPRFCIPRESATISSLTVEIFSRFRFCRVVELGRAVTSRQRRRV